jgi:quercetin dioxygenase-like cupin family protein
MPKPIPDPTADADIERRIARRLARLRAERKWSLEALAERTGIAAPRCRGWSAELSPPRCWAGCAPYGWTSRSPKPRRAPNLVPARDQAEWKDSESRYRRRIVSPPLSGFRGELVEVRMPAGASVSFDTSPIAGLEHHLWMLEGTLTLDVEGSPFWLRTGDCLRYVLAGSTRFKNPGKREARYLVAMVRP